MAVQPKEPDQPVPILVIGMNRSGTKWLSNLLCNHPDVTGIQDERHDGILETNMFGPLPQAVGDIRRIENYFAMVELWAQTDFFKCTGVAKELLYEFDPRPESCAAAFALVMDRVARARGARFWLQKYSPLDVWPALQQFPDSRLLLIERDMMATLESRIQLRRNLGTEMSLLRAAYLHTLQQKLLRRIRRHHDAIVLRYESLRADPQGEVRRICEWLGIPYREAMLEVPFRKNTSFEDLARERFVFGARDKALLRATAAVLSLVPLQILNGLRTRFATKSPPFIEGTFREIEERFPRPKPRSD